MAVPLVRDVMSRSHVAVRDSGLGEALRAGPPVAVRTWEVTNEPVTTPAYAGCRASCGAVTVRRRPLASITAWPTNAASRW